MTKIKAKQIISLLLCLLLLMRGNLLFPFEAEAANVQRNVPLISQIIEVGSNAKYQNGCWAACAISVLKHKSNIRPTMAQFITTVKGNDADVIGSTSDIKNGQLTYSGGKCLRLPYGYAMSWSDTMYWINLNQPIVCNV